MTEAVTLLCPNGVAVTTQTRVARRTRYRNRHHPLELADDVAARLHQAGLTLARLRVGGHSTAIRLYWPEIVRQLFHDEAPDEQVRVPFPSAGDIDRMDETFRWLTFLPEHPDRLRRIVLRRLIVSARSEKPRHSWRALGKEFGISHEAARILHADAVAAIARKIASGEKTR